MTEIIKIEKGSPHILLAAALIKEYVAELNVDLAFQGLEGELNSPIDKYGSEGGALLIGFYHRQPVGCIALQQLLLNDTCEMKRLYVKPEFRKMGFADNLVVHLLEEAKKQGYKRMVLDTLQSLVAAVTLYQKFGFACTSPYYHNPLPGVIFMEKVL